MGSEVNRAVDEQAKEVAEYGSSNRRLLPTSLSATIQQFKEQAKQENNTWRKQANKLINLISPNLPSPSFIKATRDLNRRQINVLTQTRLGHIALNK
jgi:hypothetical protein